MLNEEISRVDKITAFRAGIIGIFLVIVGVINDITGITFLWKSDSHFDEIFLRRAHGIWTGVLVCLTFPLRSLNYGIELLTYNSAILQYQKLYTVYAKYIII